MNNHGGIDEGMQTELGNHHQTGRKPTAVVLPCGSLICHLSHEEDSDTAPFIDVVI